VSVKHLSLAVLLCAITSSSAFAELRHVELKTLGMD
jgi:hypothetical protein